MSDRQRSFSLYVAAMLLLTIGVVLAAGRFPGGFDPAYTVMSALASRKHNPQGAIWFSAALTAAMLLLLPVSGYLNEGANPSRGRPRISIAWLRTGLVCGALLGAERLFIYHLSDLIYKAHELIAVLTFVALYCGIIGLYLHRVRGTGSFSWPALLVLFPLVAIGLGQLALYVEQRDTGWVDVGWRELGVPLWLSFAFWQWVAVGLLWLGLGHLVLSQDAVRRVAIPGG